MSSFFTLFQSFYTSTSGNKRSKNVVNIDQLTYSRLSSSPNLELAETIWFVDNIPSLGYKEQTWLQMKYDDIAESTVLSLIYWP